MHLYCGLDSFVSALGMTEKVINRSSSLVIYCLLVGVCAEFDRSESWFPDWNWESFFRTNPYSGTSKRILYKFNLIYGK